MRQRRVEVELELEELDDPPPPPLDELDELDELDDELLELLLLDDELELDELRPDEEDAVAAAGFSPPQAVSTPTPASAAPPESRIRKSRRSVSAATSRVSS